LRQEFGFGFGCSTERNHSGTFIPGGKTPNLTGFQFKKGTFRNFGVCIGFFPKGLWGFLRERGTPGLSFQFRVWAICLKGGQGKNFLLNWLGVFGECRAFFTLVSKGIFPNPVTQFGVFTPQISEVF